MIIVLKKTVCANLRSLMVPPSLRLVDKSLSQSPALSPRSMIPSPAMLFNVPYSDDHVVNALCKWMTDGAEGEDSLGGIVALEQLEQHLNLYLSAYAPDARRLAVIVVVKDDDDALLERCKALLERCSESGAAKCSTKGAFRSQIDIRLVTISRILTQSLLPAPSPLRKLFH